MFETLGDPYNIEAIAREYDLLLMDTSATSIQINPRERIRNKEIIRADFEKRITYCRALCRYVENVTPLYITEGVASELRADKHYSNPPKAPWIPQRTLMRLLNEANKLRRAFESNDKILTFSGEEELEYIRLNNTYLKEGIGIGCSEVDIDYLFRGVAIVLEGRSCGLLCNDVGILKLWKSITRRENIPPSKLGFYLNLYTTVFEDTEQHAQRAREAGYFA